MSGTQKRDAEIAGEILIAWIEHLPTGISRENWATDTAKIAEAYKTIYQAVYDPTQ